MRSDLKYFISLNGGIIKTNVVKKNDIYCLYCFQLSGKKEKKVLELKMML